MSIKSQKDADVISHQTNPYDFWSLRAPEQSACSNSQKEES